MQGEEVVKKRIKALMKEIEVISRNKEMIILESEARTLNTNAINKQTDATKKLNKEKEKEKLIREGLLVSDASMGDVPVNAHLNAFTNEERLEGVKNIANQEFEVMKKVNDDKIKAIMENDALQLELQRIQAEKKISIDKETALNNGEFKNK